MIQGRIESRTKRLLLVSASVAGLSTMAAAPAFAQADAPAVQQGESQAAPAASLGLDSEIIVTASRVQRSGFTAPTPTTIVGAAALENRGATNVATVLNEIPAFKASTTPATNGVRAIFPGSYYADLRGLSSSRTLVLVNGNRFVPQITTGLSGYQVDLNQIPSLMLERAEVVTGGASAQWGSDAVAGVVNLILKKDFEGIQAEAQYGLSEQGDNQEYRFGILGGTRLGERAHLEVAFDYVNNKGVGDVFTRGWGRKGYGLVANPCALNAPVSATCPDGGNGLAQTLILPDVRYATTTTGGMINSTRGPAAALRGITFGPGGTLGQFQYGQYVGSQFMQGGGSNQGINFNTGVSMIPPAKRYIGYTRLTYDVGSDFQIYAEGSYARTVAHNQTLPARNEQNTPITVKLDNPYIPDALMTIIDNYNAANPGAPITSFNVGRNWVDFGYQHSTVRNETYRGVAGFNGKIGDWSIDGALIYGHNNYVQHLQHDRIHRNFNYAVDVTTDANGDPICRAVLAGDPAAAGCQPLNVFGDGSPSQAAIDYVTGTLFSKTEYEQTAANLNIQGEPFSTWAGPVSVAIGAEYRREKQVTTVDPIAEAAGYESTNARSLRGTFNVKEAYFETVIPLLKDWVLARSLDFQGAVRYTDYSTSGSVTTWKAGGTWTPVPGLLLRGTVSRDIRAPNLFELNTPPVSTILNRVFTQSVLGGPTGQVATQNLVGGNKDLKPEKADTQTFGFSYTPPFVPGLQFSVDYYKITVKGAIASLDPNVIINYCTGATPTSPAERDYYCSFISLYDGTAAAYTIDTPFLNLNKTQRSGFDFAASYRLPLSRISTLPGSVTFQFAGNYIKHYRDNINDAGWVERAGETSASGTPHFLTTSSITYDDKLLTLALQMRTVEHGKYNNLYTEGVQINDNRVPGRTYFNLSATVRPTEHFELFGVVNNLTDVDPPLTPQNFGFPYVNTFFDPIGRSFRIGVRYRM